MFYDKTSQIFQSFSSYMLKMQFTPFPFNYSHWLKCSIINTKNTKVPCYLRDNILRKLLPNLTPLSYEDYLRDKYVVIYILRDFVVHGKFILNQDNKIVDQCGEKFHRMRISLFNFFKNKL